MDDNILEFKKKESKEKDAPAILGCPECENVFWFVTEDFEYVCALCVNAVRQV